ncbi:MAG: class I SAM-dependent methyltransferase [Anaerolineae bacterium]
MFEREQISLPDGPLTLVRAPGVSPASEAIDALLNAVRRLSGERLFVGGPGITATAAWAARAGAPITYWTSNLAEAETLRATFVAHDLPLPTLLLQENFFGLTPGDQEMALLHLPRGRTLQRELLQLAAALLRPRGRLYLVGARREGVKTAFEEARALFGRVGVLTHKGGYHAAVAERPEGKFPLPTVVYTTYEIPVTGMPTRLVSRPGVFAHGRLDDGAAALISGMRVDGGERVLDLGCGTGLVGLAALRRGAQVTGVDVSAWAVASTRRTWAANGYPEAAVHLSIGAAAVAQQRFDVVVANPPFHRGAGVNFEVAQLFITDAARVLRPGGRLYLVANAFLKYEPWLRHPFAHVETVWRNARYHVYEALR